MISSKCSSLHTKLKSGERHSDEESFVDESTKIITKGTFFFLTKCNQRHNGPLKTYKMSNKTAETVLFLNNEGKSKTFPENCDSKVPSVGTLLVYLKTTA